MWPHSKISTAKFGHLLWAQPRPSTVQFAGECGPIQTYRRPNLGTHCGPIQDHQQHYLLATVGPAKTIDITIRRRMWAHSKISTSPFSSQCGPIRNNRCFLFLSAVGPLNTVSDFSALVLNPPKILGGISMRKCWAHLAPQCILAMGPFGAFGIFAKA
jgi:hypothetical protein